MIDCVSVKQMRDFDAYTIKTKVPSCELMYRAAYSVYEEIEDLNKKIYIISGKGNNGGDGIALCHILVENGYNPYLFLIEDEISKDSKYFLDKLKGYKNIFKISECDYISDIIIDCIYGTGFHGDVDNNIKEIINNINSSNAYVISIDIPSGLNGNNGIAKCAIKADKTIAIQYLKYGHILQDGKDLCGNIIVKDIGIEKIEKVATIIEDSDIQFKKRKFNSHKGTYGRSVIIGGCENYMGAIKIANMGVSSLRVGAGLNTIATIKSMCGEIAVNIMESTIFPLDEKDGMLCFNKEQIDKLLSNATAVAVGMGMGKSEENKKIIKYIVENFSIPVLIDADGLNSLDGDLSLLKNTKASILITPHVKEFSRLTGYSVETIIDNPILCIKNTIKDSNLTILLKGTSTVIANKDEIVFVSNGTPALSKAGSGDTLSGVILGLLSQNFKMLESAYMGAFLCAKAASDLEKDYSSYGVLASDVAKQINSYIR